MDYYKILKPFLYQLPAENAHNLAVFALKNNLLPKSNTKKFSSLKVKLFDIDFDNPVGLAAGFDKNADIIAPLLSQGFGFIEVGTVTPLPQPGNPKPRLFRLTEDEAIINRLGFNNKGINYFTQNLTNRPTNSIIGTNIGKNKDTTDPISDYISLIRRVYKLSDYITVNISSPNTPGLRDLQNKEDLDILLTRILHEKENLAKEHNKQTPILIKIAPDTTQQQREDIAQIIIKHKINGLIISNTTIYGRDNLHSCHAQEKGGLSGKPLFNLSTQMVKQMYKLTAGQIPIIGVGGISSGDDAYKKIKAGASLVQLYSALIYKGFNLIDDINKQLDQLLKSDGYTNISQAVGADVVL